jgi:hypothetical protein
VFGECDIYVAGEIEILILLRRISNFPEFQFLLQQRLKDKNL